MKEETALIGWAAGPTGRGNAADLRDRGGGGHVEDYGLHMEFLETRLPGDSRLGARRDSHRAQQFAAAPDPDDLLDVAWIGRLT